MAILAATVVMQCHSPAADALSPRVTSTATVDISIGGAAPKPLSLGLYGEAAPASVELFESLCTGRELSYVGSTAIRIEKDRAIVLGKLSGGTAQYIEKNIDSTGYVRSELVNRADSFVNDDSPPTAHDRGGLVSMRRGGRAFEFVVSPAANAALDADYIVVGEVSDGSSFVQELNTVPARKPTATAMVYGAAAKASGDVRSRIEQDFRPLVKVQINGCSLAPRPPGGD